MLAATLCLALVVFHEARAEPIKGQYAVLEVVHNRTKSKAFPNDYCSVVKQKNQFSWTKKHPIAPPKKELKAWEHSIKIAQSFQSNKTDYTRGALYFNTNSLGVRFNKTLKARIGGHTFF